jgi:hypothetical protein
MLSTCTQSRTSIEVAICSPLPPQINVLVVICQIRVHSSALLILPITGVSPGFFPERQVQVTRLVEALWAVCWATTSPM